MFLSSGYGYLVVLIWFGCAILLELLTQVVSQNADYFAKNGWPKLLACWIAAAIVWKLSRSLNCREVKALSDPRTGVGGVTVSEGKNLVRHHCLFIPMEYWGYIFVALGIICLFLTEGD